MKLRVSPWRLIWRFLVIMVCIYAVAFVMLITMFFTVDFQTFTFTPIPWDFRQLLLIAGIFVVGVAAFIPSLISYYYVCENKYFIMRKYWKEYEFTYSNITFIDIEKSKAKKMVIFYNEKSRMQYLLGDKDGVLLDTLIKKCPETMSVAEFRARHPEEKY